MVVRNSSKKVEAALVVRHQREPEPLPEDDLGGSVTMSRALAQSAHGLTLNEARVMMLATRCIDPRKSPYAYAKDGYVKVRVTADEFARMAEMEGEDGRTPTAAYEGLKAACDKLFDRRASWRKARNRSGWHGSGRPPITMARDGPKSVSAQT